MSGKAVPRLGRRQQIRGNTDSPGKFRRPFLSEPLKRPASAQSCFFSAVSQRGQLLGIWILPGQGGHLRGSWGVLGSRIHRGGQTGGFGALPSGDAAGGKQAGPRCKDGLGSPAPRLLSPDLLAPLLPGPRHVAQRQGQGLIVSLIKQPPAAILSPPQAHGLFQMFLIKTPRFLNFRRVAAESYLQQRGAPGGLRRLSVRLWPGA